MLTVTDVVNNYYPKFSAPEYEIILPVPFPEALIIPPEFFKNEIKHISATDMDISNTEISFGISPAEDFEPVNIKVEDTLRKTYGFELKTKQNISYLDRREYIITAYV